MVQLVLEASILNPEVLLLEGNLSNDGGATAAGADRVPHRITEGHVLSSEPVVLPAELRVLVPLELGLMQHSHNTKTFLHGNPRFFL